MFLAKIAQGRTLKEFSLFNFVLPGLFGMLWFAIFGGAAIYMEAGGAGIYESMASLGTEAAVFAFFNNLPLSKILSVVFMITAFLSVVTLCESMTTTVASITLTGEDVASEEPPPKSRSSGAWSWRRWPLSTSWWPASPATPPASTPPSCWPSPAPSPALCGGGNGNQLF